MKNNDTGMNIFHTFSSASTVEPEQVNVCWEDSYGNWLGPW